MDIDSVFKKWDEAKKKKAEAEKECDMYKDAVEKYMSKKEKNTIEGTYYKCQKRSITREHLSKDMVPSDIWQKYSKRFSYISYYLTKNI